MSPITTNTFSLNKFAALDIVEVDDDDQTVIEDGTPDEFALKKEVIVSKSSLESVVHSEGDFIEVSTKRRHRRRRGKFTQWCCELCEPCTRFPTHHDLKRHEAMDHYYCLKCDRAFRSLTDRLHHLQISPHERTEVRCVGGESRCPKKFTNLAAVLKHIEIGKCPSGLTACDIGEWIARHDPKNLITDKETSKHLLPLEKNIIPVVGWEESSSIFDDKSSIAGTSDSTLIGGGEAFICGVCTKSFPLHQSLKSHLASPIHRREPHIYHCPQPGCMKTFRALSSLLSHFDSGFCGASRVVWSPMKCAIIRQLAIARVEGTRADERELYKRAFLDAYSAVAAGVKAAS